jgi:hypothetical protein
MSDYDDQLEGTELVKQLRNQLKAQTKANNEALEELKGFRQEQRTRTVASKLTEKGLNAKVAKLVPQDVEDVDAWLTEYGDVFGITQDGNAAPPPEAAAQSRVSNLEALGQGGSESLQNRINSATNADELMKIIASSR